MARTVFLDRSRYFQRASPTRRAQELEGFA